MTPTGASRSSCCHEKGQRWHRRQRGHRGMPHSSSVMIVAVIPAFNEATRIASVVNDARKHVDRVIVVDDGSTDGTADAARAVGALVVRHPENSGAGAATMTGIEAARALGATVVVTLDADEQHAPNA